MKISKTLYVPIVALLFFTGVTSTAGEKSSTNPQKSDSDNVKAALESLHTALAARDMSKMQNVWAHEPYTILINPRDKAAAIGWDAVTKDWAAAFDFWSEFKVTVKDVPRIHVSKHGTAWSTSVAVAEGKTKTGQALTYTVLETDVFEKRGTRWLLVSHHESRMPD